MHLKSHVWFLSKDTSVYKDPEFSKWFLNFHCCFVKTDLEKRIPLIVCVPIVPRIALESVLLPQL